MLLFVYENHKILDIANGKKLKEKFMLKNIFIFIIITCNLLLAQEYFPLEDGLTKLYKGKSKDFTKKEIIKKEVNTFRITTNTNLGDVTIESQKIYSFDETGVYEVASGGGILQGSVTFHKSPYPLLKYPLKINQEWSYVEDGGRKITRQTVDTLSEFKIGTKTYNDVLKIRHTIRDGGKDWVSIEYYSKTHGLIKVELADGTLFLYLAE